jgi:SAM-dependent methyltransferase
MKPPVAHPIGQYDNVERSKQIIAKGQHRNLVGGFWDELGELQVNFLKDQGLRPEHRVLDVGCGCLRAGVKIIPYLEPNHYYGIDAEKQLLDVGYGKELAKAGLSDRLDRNNLYCSRLFKHQRLEAGSIDMGISVSVMTHLPLNYLKICLENSAVYYKSGAKFFLTFFEVPPSVKFSEKYVNEAGIGTFAFMDPYHYQADDMLYAAHNTPWTARYIGDWSHPRGQRMVEYTKV